MLSDYQNYVIEVSSGMFKKEKEKTKQWWKAMNACSKDEKKTSSEREVYRLLLSPIVIVSIVVKGGRMIFRDVMILYKKKEKE